MTAAAAKSRCRSQNLQRATNRLLHRFKCQCAVLIGNQTGERASTEDSKEGRTCMAWREYLVTIAERAGLSS